MNVTELFRRLSYGPLSNLAIGTEGSGTIEAARQPKVISYLNDALLDLYSRFALRYNDVLIETQEHIVYYHLKPQYALSNQDPCPGIALYIQDRTSDPFLDDVIKILSVTDTYGSAMPLNDFDHPDSVFTPQPDTLQVPNPLEGEPLAIVYQARHPHIEYDDLEAKIDVPFTFERAVIAHVAYQVFSHMGGQENALKAQEHYTTYESICTRAQEMDLTNRHLAQTQTRFELKGFR